MPYEMATLKKLKMSKKNVEFCLKSSSLTLLKWDSIMDIFLGNVPTSFFFGGGSVHSTLRKYSTSWKCSLHFVDIFRADWKFLIKFCSSDPSFNRNILRFQHLKFQTCAHAHIAITYV